MVYILPDDELEKQVRYFKPEKTDPEYDVDDMTSA